MTNIVWQNGTAASPANPPGAENRRSVRLPRSIAVEMSYIDSRDQPQLERTHTLSIDRHGARIATASFHPEGRRVHLCIPHLGQSAHCRIVWCSAPSNGSYEVGVEMEGENDVWRVSFQT